MPWACNPGYISDKSLVDMESYSTVVPYIRIKKVKKTLAKKYYSKTSLNIYILRDGKYWLGTVKPINVFRSILNPSIK